MTVCKYKWALWIDAEVEDKAATMAHLVVSTVRHSIAGVVWKKRAVARCQRRTHLVQLRRIIKHVSKCISLQ